MSFAKIIEVDTGAEDEEKAQQLFAELQDLGGSGGILRRQDDAEAV